MIDKTRHWLGKRVKVKIDRPLGSKHPDFKLKTIYPINYGFIPDTFSEIDQEEIDAYVFGPTEPVKEFIGIVIAIIQRKDGEIKLVVSDGQDYSIKEIKELTDLQEKYHQSVIFK